MNDPGPAALRQLRHEVYVMSLLVRALRSRPEPWDATYFLAQLDRCAGRADRLAQQLGWGRPSGAPEPVAQARAPASGPAAIPARVIVGAPRRVTTAPRPR